MENNNPAPKPNLVQNIEHSKVIELKFGDKIYPLEIYINQDNIIFNIQEKYNLYSHQAKFTYHQFLNLHKFFRMFDNLNEIYCELIKGNITIKNINQDNKDAIILVYKLNINNNISDINFTLNKKDLDKIKDIDIIISNYYLMKKELEELSHLKDKITNSNLFIESKWLKNNYNAINLIQEGINHQLNKKIIETNLLYKCTRDGDDNKIFHSKWDGIDNTLIIGESTNGRIFGGFASQKWNNKDEKRINDDYSFLFQINDLKNYYSIKGKEGGIYCSQHYGPIFVSNESSIEFGFQCYGKALENNNNDYTGYSKTKLYYDYGNNKYVLEGHDYYSLKDYEVFKLTFD